MYVQKGTPCVRVASVHEEPNPQARSPSLEGPHLKFDGERSARLQEQIGPGDTLTTQQLLL